VREGCTAKAGTEKTAVVFVVFLSTTTTKERRRVYYSSLDTIYEQNNVTADLKGITLALVRLPLRLATLLRDPGVGTAHEERPRALDGVAKGGVAGEKRRERGEKVRKLEVGEKGEKGTHSCVDGAAGFHCWWIGSSFGACSGRTKYQYGCGRQQKWRGKNDGG
jgi:hypothetical protein